jgi:hypothetical protein
MKALMVILLAAILLALGSAGFFMLRRPGEDDPKGRMARALALRVALSVGLFGLVLLGWHMGWVKPGGLPTGR